MSASPDTLVSVELPYRDWCEVADKLDMHGREWGERVAQKVIDQLPPLTPTGLGAVVRARLSAEAARDFVFVLCSMPATEDNLSWHDPTDGSWYEPDQFEVTEVLSKGIPWPQG